MVSPVENRVLLEKETRHFRKHQRASKTHNIFSSHHYTRSTIIPRKEHNGGSRKMSAEEIDRAYALAMSVDSKLSFLRSRLHRIRDAVAAPRGGSVRGAESVSVSSLRLGDDGWPFFHFTLCPASAAAGSRFPPSAAPPPRRRSSVPIAGARSSAMPGIRRGGRRGCPERRRPGRTPSKRRSPGACSDIRRGSDPPRRRIPVAMMRFGTGSVPSRRVPPGGRPAAAFPGNFRHRHQRSFPPSGHRLWIFRRTRRRRSCPTRGARRWPRRRRRSSRSRPKGPSRSDRRRRRCCISPTPAREGPSRNPSSAPSRTMRSTSSGFRDRCVFLRFR
mmetsp:Transcript_21221/g.50420  ORF Transcript_21221/g.50420 Transcript_21221/m.50420 type:complete len:331 (+) Transcript_21221:101-1093(+)